MNWVMHLMNENGNAIETKQFESYDDAVKGIDIFGIVLYNEKVSDEEKICSIVILNRVRVCYLKLTVQS